MHYTITEQPVDGGMLLKVAFGQPASNDVIVVDAKAALEALNLQGGRTVYITGPASLPVAFVLAHGVAHLFAQVAIFDPKMGGYVVAVSHGGDPVGTVLSAPAEE